MTLYIKTLKKRVLYSLLSLFVLSCTSTPPDAEGKTQHKPDHNNSVLEEVTDADLSKSQMMETSEDPTYAQLMQLLSSLGYEGVGLQFESRERLNLLIQVFSNPKAAHRNLRLVYTGTQWSYDLKHQSLTVGEGKDANQILTYIEKNIKLKPLNQRKPIVKPAPVVPQPPIAFPKKLPDEINHSIQKQVPEPLPAPVDVPTPTPKVIPSPPAETVPETSPEAVAPPPPVLEEPVSPVESNSVSPIPSTSEENEPIKGK